MFCNCEHAVQTLTKSFLTRILGKVECELVEVLELPRISDILLQRLTPLLQLLYRITAETNERAHHFDPSQYRTLCMCEGLVPRLHFDQSRYWTLCMCEGLVPKLHFDQSRYWTLCM